MANQSLKFWAIPLTLWGLYSCWYFGYQSGYADGHVTAWNMSRQDHAMLRAGLGYSDEASDLKTASTTAGR